MKKNETALDLDVELKRAINIAKKAGYRISQDLVNIRKIKTNARRDVKLVADILSEEYIFSLLASGIGYNCEFLGEEGGRRVIGARDSGYRWIVDPLDGSLNYNRGIPLYAISIALWNRMQPLIGVVNAFSHGELFYGISGRGAYLNGTAITPSAVKKKNNAICCTGFPIATNFGKRPLMAFIKNIQNFKKVRLLGSAALSLAYVASGRADYYKEKDIKIWDIAAGIALVNSAGGKFRIERSNKKYCYTITGTNGQLPF